MRPQLRHLCQLIETLQTENIRLALVLARSQGLLRFLYAIYGLKFWRLVKEQPLERWLARQILKRCLFASKQGWRTMRTSRRLRVTKIMCENNELRSINFSHLPRLRLLQCSYNFIEELDTSAYPRLLDLFCEHNQIRGLKLPNHGRLQLLDCSENPITALDIRPQQRLIKLWCQGCNLSEEGLQLGTHSQMRLFCCHRNPIQRLDLRGMPNLEFLNCEGCQLTDLPIGIEQLSELKTAYLGGNKIPYERIQWLKKQLPDCQIYGW